MIPVIKAGLQSLQLADAGAEQAMFTSYLIKTGTYIAAQLALLFQECALVIQQQQEGTEEGELWRGGREARGDLTVMSPFLSECVLRQLCCG